MGRKGRDNRSTRQAILFQEFRYLVDDAPRDNFQLDVVVDGITKKVQDILEVRHTLAGELRCKPGAGVESFEVPVGQIGDGEATAGYSGHRRIVDDDRLPILCGSNVELDAGNPFLENQPKRGQGVFRCLGGAAPVGKEKRVACVRQDVVGRYVKNALSCRKLAVSTRRGTGGEKVWNLFPAPEYLLEYDTERQG